MWDLAEDKHSIKLIESFLAAGKPIAIVCHSTGALRHVKTPGGKPLVQSKEVTGFTNGEEEAMGLTKVVPFLVEDKMLRLGAIFSKKANWAVHVVSDDLLITGQNPASYGPSREDPDGGAEAKGQTGCQRSGFVDRRIYRVAKRVLQFTNSALTMSPCDL
jgi:hypothetical protein